MRTPRPEDFDPKFRDQKVDEIDLSNVVPLLPKQEIKLEVDNVRKRTSGQVHKSASGQADKQTSGRLSLPDFLKLHLENKGAAKETFRLPPELIEVVDMLPFQIKMAHKVKTSKKSIVALALAYVIWDYEKNGEESLLYKNLIRAK
jgi:hypothetical protein